LKDVEIIEKASLQIKDTYANNKKNLVDIKTDLGMIFDEVMSMEKEMDVLIERYDLENKDY
jgi:hypothetical protein